MNAQTKLFQSICYILALSIGAVSVVAYFWLLPPEIPLFYSLYGLQSQLASKEMIFLVPGLSLLFALISTAITRVKNLDETVKVLHSLGTMITLIMMFLLVVRLLFLVLP